MKKTTQYIAMAALIFSLAACTQDDTLQGFNDPNAVRINATIGHLQSRVSYGADGATSFSAGDAIQVENIKRTTKNIATYTTANGSSWTTQDAFVWNSGTEANNQFQAWYPATASFDAFDLPTDQDTDAKLAAADWMTASTDAMAKPEDGELNLSFTHKLAKVTVNINSEYGAEYTTAPTISDVKIYTYDGGKEITPLAGTNSYTAIVTPGEAYTTTPFMTLKANGVALTVKPTATLTAEGGLAAGSHYTFTLKVGKDAATISTVTVGDWDTETIPGGVAEDITPVIDGSLGGKATATEDDITALVEKLEEYVDNGITTITVPGSQPAMITVGNVTVTAIGEAIYRLSKEESYNGKIDLILPDVTEIVDQEFDGAFALNSITLPKVTTVGNGAFVDCFYLRKITFGSVVTSINQSNTVVFHRIAEKIDGCDLVLNCGQLQAEDTYKPDLENNVWFKPSWGGNVTWKSITLTHTGECGH